MTGAQLLMADVPLVLIAVLWWQARRDDDASNRLERLMVSQLLVATSAVLWNGLAGGEVLWQRWPTHASLAVIAAVMPFTWRRTVPDLSLSTLLGKAAAYAGGFALAALSSGWNLGQYALRA